MVVAKKEEVDPAISASLGLVSAVRPRGTSAIAQYLAWFSRGSRVAVIR